VPPLICPSPSILDQTFPRNDEELSIINEAMGEIQKCIDENSINLLLTDTLRLFVDDFDWNRTGPYPELSIIYHLLNQWSFQPSERIISVSTDDVLDFHPHPIPEGTSESVYVNLWSEEIGKVLEKHNIYRKGNKYFIGISCEKAFAGLQKGEYINPESIDAFPLIGPFELNMLDDAYEWDVPLRIRTARISFSLFIKNCKIIGATDVEIPHRDSHYHIYFGNFRWQLSCNDKLIPDIFLQELESVLNLPLPVIKYAIIEEKYPEKNLRIH
jgi:hypothetical protein